MFPVFDPLEKHRHEVLLDRATQHAATVESALHKSTLDIATEVTQYFEKLALGSGATIAAIVSFIGSHSTKLIPSYLLRSALVITMIAAMYRNWRFPRYVLANYQGQSYAAKLNQERCKRDLFLAVPATSLQDGKVVDPVDFARYFEGIEPIMTASIARFKKVETRVINEVKWVGNVSLFCAVAGVIQLIVLAWINF
jgi:hypothetical protein